MPHVLLLGMRNSMPRFLYVRWWGPFVHGEGGEWATILAANASRRDQSRLWPLTPVWSKLILQVRCTYAQDWLGNVITCARHQRCMRAAEEVLVLLYHEDNCILAWCNPLWHEMFAPENFRSQELLFSRSTGTFVNRKLHSKLILVFY